MESLSVCMVVMALLQTNPAWRLPDKCYLASSCMQLPSQQRQPGTGLASTYPCASKTPPGYSVAAPLQRRPAVQDFGSLF